MEASVRTVIFLHLPIEQTTNVCGRLNYSWFSILISYDMLMWNGHHWAYIMFDHVSCGYLKHQPTQAIPETSHSVLLHHYFPTHWSSIIY